MEYGINIGFCIREGGLKRAAERVAEAGFTMLDYTPDLASDDWSKQAEEAKRIFDACGLTVHQTHAPFNRYRSYSPEVFLLCLERCAEVTQQLGAEFMVAHGDEFDFSAMEFTPEAALEINHKLYRPYVEQGEKNGYKVAFETVFDDMGLRRFTSRPEELLGLITSFHSDSAVCCWDFGHAHVAMKRKAPEAILQLGSLIQCTHLHDNSGVDAHQIPRTGDIDWTKTMKALRQIGYHGVLSVEYAHGSIPEELMDSFVRFSYDCAVSAWKCAE